MKRTPWFNYSEHAPVNEGDYETRCRKCLPQVELARYSRYRFGSRLDGNVIIRFCDHCQWRGLTTKDGK